MLRKYNDLIVEFENKIAYEFKDKYLLLQSLSHTSFVNERNAVRKDKVLSYERLEFLGDSVLGIVAAEYFYKKYPEHKEGKLTELKISAVCEQYLARCSRDFGFNKYILLGRGEEASGSRNRDSIISDVMEAIIGALYLDGGFTSAKEFINKFILNDYEKKHLFFNSKNILQEYTQKYFKNVPEYCLVKETGKDNEKIFDVVVFVNGEQLGVGNGTSKKLAEQKAAYEAILKINEK